MLLADLHWLEPAEATVVVVVVLLDSRLSEMQGQIASICSWATCSRRSLNSGRVTRMGAEDDSTSLVGSKDALEASHSRSARFNEQAEAGWERAGSQRRPIAIDSW